jgi:hypothetical protein
LGILIASPGPITQLEYFEKKVGTSGIFIPASSAWSR